MILSVFASGSAGNCSLLSEGDCHVLLDVGISLRKLRAALALRGLSPAELAGVLITHEHKDHIAGLPMLTKRWGVPIYAPRTVANHIRWSAAGVDGYIREIRPGCPFPLGPFTVTAFPTSHDTDQSVGYRLDGSASFSLCTDTGCVTEEMLSVLSGSTAAVIEANHDVDMLCAGPYPWYLKQRILSRRGHLSNNDSAALCRRLAEAGLQTLVLGHLSRENNRPSLAEGAVKAALRGLDVALYTAPEWGHLCLEIEPCSK